VWCLKIMMFFHWDCWGRCNKRWIVLWCAGVVNCLSLPEVDPLGPIYIINRCPDIRGIDDVTRRRCEAESSNADNSLFTKLPVVGSNTGALYRNAFCATCNSERDPSYVYWIAKLEVCSKSFSSPRYSRLDDIVKRYFHNGKYRLYRTNGTNLVGLICYMQLLIELSLNWHGCGCFWPHHNSLFDYQGTLYNVYYLLCL
jgi:hypothetical protein